MVPCSVSSNHLNQEGFADCFECNPRFHRDRELKRLQADVVDEPERLQADGVDEPDVDGVDEPDSVKNSSRHTPSTGSNGGRPAYYKQPKRSKTM